MAQPAPGDLADGVDADWQRRVVGRSLRTAAERSVDRGMTLIRAAAAVLDRSGGEDITVQDVADEAGQSLRTLYQYFESKDDLLLAVFEESMRTYAHLIEQAITGLDDPLERLAGAMVAAVRMPEVSGTGLDRGLVRLRIRLSQVKPELVGRAQSAVTSFVRGLVEAAATAGRIDVADTEAATFMILSLNSAFITSDTIGNDAGVRGPDAFGLVSFCLRGLGADLPKRMYEDLAARLVFPARSRRAERLGRGGGARPSARRRVAKG